MTSVATCVGWDVILRLGPRGKPVAAGVTDHTLRWSADKNAAEVARIAAGPQVSAGQGEACLDVVETNLLCILFRRRCPGDCTDGHRNGTDRRYQIGSNSCTGCHHPLKPAFDTTWVCFFLHPSISSLSFLFRRLQVVLTGC